MTDNRSGPLDELISPLSQLFVILIVAFVLMTAGSVTTGLVSTALHVSVLIMILLGGYRTVTAPPPRERFEVGTFHGGHQYNETTIEATVDIRYDEDEQMKVRTVECTAVAEDGTTIFRERDTDVIGEKPHSFNLLGGDFDGVRSTTDHILAVSTPVHEYVDEWLASEGNDPAVKAALETEFVNIESEMSQER